jgi:pyruvate,water dikinase
MADMSPGLIKPLQWSTNTLAMANTVFGRLFTELIGPNEIDFNKSLRLIHSRVYANLSFFEDLFQQIGLPINFFEMIAREERGRRRRPPITSRLLAFVTLRILPFLFKYARRANHINNFIKNQDAALDLYRKANWNGVDLQNKYEYLKNLMEVHNKAQWYIIITALNMNIRNSILKKMVRRHAPSVEPSNLIKGLAGLKGLEPNKELQRLSGYLHGLDEQLMQLCIEGDDLEIRNQLGKSEKGKKLIDRFDSFMEKFGHLSANTTNFTETPWIENPKIIWNAIGSAANYPQKKTDDNTQQMRHETRQEVLKNLRFLQRPVFQHFLNSTVAYLTLREQISMLLSEDTYQFRRLILSIGSDLVEKDLIGQADDIFYLYYTELELLLKNEMDPKYIIKEIKTRHKQIIIDEQLTPEDTICGDQIRTQPEVDLSTSEFLTGICGSSGYRQGYAYVIHNPDDLAKTLTAEHILVVPFTHVGWTPLFSSIGGIIAESGGQLSHTAIIAREYGIPASVSVRNAMQLIKTGQPLTLDATSGRIYLNHININKGD